MGGKLSSQTPHCGVSNDLQDRWQMPVPVADQNPPTIGSIVAVWVVGRGYFRGRQRVSVSGFPGGSWCHIWSRRILDVPVRWSVFKLIVIFRIIISVTSHSRSVGNGKILDVPDTRATASYVPFLILTPVAGNREDAVPRLTFCLGIKAGFFSFKFGLPVVRKWFLELSLPTFEIIESFMFLTSSVASTDYDATPRAIVAGRDAWGWHFQLRGSRLLSHVLPES